jgi:hypothetical protein
MEKLSWHTQEYHYREKSADWYWVVGIVSISLAIIAVILNNIIFAIFIIVSAFSLSLFASKKPNLVEISIEKDSVAIGDKRHSYEGFESFWVETKDGIPRMLFRSKKIYAPLLVVFIDDVDPEKVREALSEYLPEEELSEPFLEKLLIYLGF